MLMTNTDMEKEKKKKKAVSLKMSQYQLLASDPVLVAFVTPCRFFILSWLLPLAALVAEWCLYCTILHARDGLRPSALELRIAIMVSIF